MKAADLNLEIPSIEATSKTEEVPLVHFPIGEFILRTFIVVFGLLLGVIAAVVVAAFAGWLVFVC